MATLTIEQLVRVVKQAERDGVEYVTVRIGGELADVESATIEIDRGQTEDKVLVLTPKP